MGIYNSYEFSILLPNGTLHDFMRHVGQLQPSFTAKRNSDGPSQPSLYPCNTSQTLRLQVDLTWSLKLQDLKLAVSFLPPFLFLLSFFSD